MYVHKKLFLVDLCKETKTMVNSMDNIEVSVKIGNRVEGDGVENVGTVVENDHDILGDARRRSGLQVNK